MKRLLSLCSMVLACAFAGLPVSLADSEIGQTSSEPAATETVATEAVATLAEPAPARLVTGQERSALLKEIARAFGDIRTVKGRFSQTDANFNTVTGDFYLRRPGRVRFDYADPSPLLIIADGVTVAIEDRDLETQDRVPLKATPLSFLLDDALDFDTGAEVTELARTDDLIQVSLIDPSAEMEGTLSILLDAADYSILEWWTRDEAGQVTRIQLSGVETGVRINPRLFRIEDPNGEDERE